MPLPGLKGEETGIQSRRDQRCIEAEGTVDKRPRDAEATGGRKDHETEQKSVFCEYRLRIR